MDHIRATGRVTADDTFEIEPPAVGVPVWTLYLGMNSPNGMTLHFADVADLRRLRDALIEEVPGA